MTRVSLRKQKKQTCKTGLRAGILIIAALMIVSCSLLPDSVTSLFSQQTNQTTEQDILIPVTRGTISSSLSFVGNLRYKQSSEQAWKTDGVVEKVYVKVGDTVKKGDLLAELAADSLSPRVLLAEKTMIECRENLEDVQSSVSSRMQAYVDLSDKENALTQAKLTQEALYYPRATRFEMERAWDAFALAHLNFNYAKQDYDFLVSLGEGWEGQEEGREIRMFGGQTLIIGADSRSARERKFEDYVSAYETLVSAYEKYVWTSGRPSNTDYAVAEGNVQVAQKEYEKALELFRSYDIVPRPKDVHAAEISLINAQTVYEQRFIFAPFDGIVTSVSAVESYYVKKGSAAARIDDMSEIFVPINISELDLGIVTNRTAVNIIVDAVPGKVYTGHLYSISEASTDTGSSTSFGAMVSIDDPDKNLFAGMTAEVSVPVNEKKDVLLIPDTAVTYSDGKSFVTRVNGTDRQLIEIKIGNMSGNIFEVISDEIQEGDQLAVSSITEDTLVRLGLDPSVYLSGGQGRGSGMWGSSSSEFRRNVE